MAGMTEERFWESTPSEVEPYAKAHLLRQKEQVELANLSAWLQGVYFRSAIASSVFTAELPEKRKQLPPYPKKPFDLNTGETEGDNEMTKEQIEMARLRERIKMDSLIRALKEKCKQGR